MKKLLFLFCLCISFSLFWSCSKSNEEKVKDAFNDYVESNFNNPADLKEIISITIKDSISNKKTVDFANSSLETIDTIMRGISRMNDSLHKIVETTINTPSIINKYIGNSHAYKLMQDVEKTSKDYFSYIIESNESLDLVTSRKKLESDIKKLQSDNIVIIVYEIKTRINTNDNSILKTYYAHHNMINNSISIYQDDNMDNYPKAITDIYKSLDSYLKNYKVCQQKAINNNLALKKWIDFIK